MSIYSYIRWSLAHGRDISGHSLFIQKHIISYILSKKFSDHVFIEIVHYVVCKETAFGSVVQITGVDYLLS